MFGELFSPSDLWQQSICSLLISFGSPQANDKDEPLDAKYFEPKYGGIIRKDKSSERGTHPNSKPSAYFKK